MSYNRVVQTILMIFVLTILTVQPVFSQSNWTYFTSPNGHLSFEYPETWYRTDRHDNKLYYLVGEAGLTEEQLNAISMVLNEEQIFVAILTSEGFDDPVLGTPGLNNKSPEFLLGHQAGIVQLGIQLSDIQAQRETTVISFSDIEVIQNNSSEIYLLHFSELNDGLIALILFDEDFVIVQARTHKGQFKDFEDVIFNIIESIEYTNVNEQKDE